MCPFFFFLLSPDPSLKGDSLSLLCENVKQYSVLYDKQRKGNSVWCKDQCSEQCVECGAKRPRIY